jgi:hypothetical protein
LVEVELVIIQLLPQRVVTLYLTPSLLLAEALVELALTGMVVAVVQVTVAVVQAVQELLIKVMQVAMLVEMQK